MIITNNVAVFTICYLRLALLNKLIIFTLSIGILIDSEIDFIKHDAISRYSITLCELNHVSDNQFLNWNRRCCSICTSIDYYFLIIDLIFELQELTLLDIVAACTE